MAFSLGYAPRLGLADLQDGLNPSLLNSGVAEASWQVRGVRLAISEYASYGWLNYSALRLPSSSPAFVLQVNPQLRRRESSTRARATALTAVVVPKRRWSLRLTLSYSLAGARTTPRNRVAPHQGAALRHQLEYSLESERRRLGPRPRRTIEHHTRLRLCLPGRIAGLPEPLLAPPRGRGGRRNHRNAYRASAPAASGKDLQHYGTSTASRVIASPPVSGSSFVWWPAGPAINRISSLLTSKFKGLLGDDKTTNLGGQRGRRVRPGHRVGDAGAFFAPPRPDKVAYRASKMVDLEAGILGSWQKVGGSNVPSIQKLAFVAVTIHGSALRF